MPKRSNYIIVRDKALSFGDLLEDTFVIYTHEEAIKVASQELLMTPEISLQIVDKDSKKVYNVILLNEYSVLITADASNPCGF